jgi:polyisoprenoid-binding protein YceI
VPCFDAQAAECLVFTHKEGLLSAIAHDLRIAVTRFTIDVDEDQRSIKARFDAASLRVLSAMRDGQPAPELLSEADHRKIEQNIQKDVLDAAKYPEVVFASTEVRPVEDGFAIVGQLTLHGRTRELRFTTQATGDRQVAEIRLHQPDYGIKPYSAMLGTLRVQADVTVRVSLPRG